MSKKNNKEEQKKETKNWITTTYQADIKSIHIKNDSVAPNKLENNIWYENNEEEKREARELLYTIKRAIRDCYVEKQKHGDRAIWMTIDWVDKL